MVAIASPEHSGVRHRGVFRLKSRAANLRRRWLIWVRSRHCTVFRGNERLIPQEFPRPKLGSFVIRDWPSRSSEPLVSRPIIAHELSLTEPHPGAAAVLVDERDLKLQLTSLATGSRADNWGCRDSLFCRRRLGHYDRPYRLRERCNQGENCRQAPAATTADRQKCWRAGHSR
jgi:hypothetical protein